VTRDRHVFPSKLLRLVGIEAVRNSDRPELEIFLPMVVPESVKNFEEFWSRLLDDIATSIAVPRELLDEAARTPPPDDLREWEERDIDDATDPEPREEQ
jgi:hypothetical protein